MFFNKKEDKVIKLMGEHLALCDEAFKLFKKFMSLYCEESSDEILREISFKIHMKEHEADEAEKAIQKELLEGAFLPFYRENFIKIPEMVDKLPGIAVTISKELFLYELKLPKEMKDFFLKITDGVIKTYKQFLEIFEYLPNDVNKVMKLSEKVSECEQEVDSLEWKAKKYLFKEDKTLDKTDKLVCREFITLISDMADKIENTADYIELTMIKLKV